MKSFNYFIPISSTDNQNRSKGSENGKKQKQNQPIAVINKPEFCKKDDKSLSEQAINPDLRIALFNFSRHRKTAATAIPCKKANNTENVTIYGMPQ